MDGRKYAAAAVILLFNNEIASLIALCVMGVMLLIDIACAAERERKT